MGPTEELAEKLTQAVNLKPAKQIGSPPRNVLAQADRVIR